MSSSRESAGGGGGMIRLYHFDLVRNTIDVETINRPTACCCTAIWGRYLSAQHTVSVRTCLAGTCQTDPQVDVLSAAVITVPELKGPDFVTVQVTVLSTTGA